jgi:hypothetical protein
MDQTELYAESSADMLDTSSMEDHVHDVGQRHPGAYGPTVKAPAP